MERDQWHEWINPLMPGGNKKIAHTSTNLLSSAGFFKYV